jgi:type IV secretory pathway VirB10-like protein
MKTRSKKIKRDKNYVSKNKVETSEEKPKPKEEKPKPKEEKPKQPKEEKPKQPKEEKPKQPKEEKPKQPKEEKPKQPKEEKPKQPKEEKQRSITKKSPELLKKHGYNITNRSVDRHQSLGKLVILYGVSDLIKKIDSISVENPNLLDKYNEDKKWVKNNFKSRRSVKKS